MVAATTEQSVTSSVIFCGLKLLQVVQSTVSDNVSLDAAVSSPLFCQMSAAGKALVADCHMGLAISISPSA